jgi:hypothetical protein
MNCKYCKCCCNQNRYRAREIYEKLQNLVNNYGIKLSKNYTVDDDPNEMETEYNIHKDKIKKETNVKFYKQIILSMIMAIEYLTDKYGSQNDLNLNGWSNRIAQSIDDYDEILEEIHFKYKENFSFNSPELKIISKLFLDGMMYNASQQTFKRQQNDFTNNNFNSL